MFPHRPLATHFLHPGGEFALPSVWSLLFYLTKEMNIYSPSSHWTSTRCLTLKEAEIVKPIFQGNMQWLAQSHIVAGSQLRLWMMSWCPREHRVCGVRGRVRNKHIFFWWKLLCSQHSLHSKKARVYQGLLCPGHQAKGIGAVFPFYPQSLQ